MDFKAILDGKIEVFEPLVNSENYQNLASLCGKLPGKPIQPTEIVRIWIQQNFLESIPKIGVSDSVNVLIPVLKKFNSENLLKLVEIVTFGEKFAIPFKPMQREQLLESFFKIANQQQLR